MIRDEIRTVRGGREVHDDVDVADPLLEHMGLGELTLHVGEPANRRGPVEAANHVAAPGQLRGNGRPIAPDAPVTSTRITDLTMNGARW